MTIFWPFDIGFAGGGDVQLRSGFCLYLNNRENQELIWYVLQSAGVFDQSHYNRYRIHKRTLAVDNSSNCDDVIIQSKACDLLQWRIVLGDFYNRLKPNVV